MKKEFSTYCEQRGLSVVRLDDQECEVDVPRSADQIADFLADSPLPTDDRVDLFRGLDHLVDREGLKLLEVGNWKLTAQPRGFVPIPGGMIRLTVKF